MEVIRPTDDTDDTDKLDKSMPRDEICEICGARISGRNKAHG